MPSKELHSTSTERWSQQLKLSRRFHKRANNYKYYSNKWPCTLKSSTTKKQNRYSLRNSGVKNKVCKREFKQQVAPWFCRPQILVFPLGSGGHLSLHSLDRKFVSVSRAFSPSSCVSKREPNITWTMKREISYVGMSVNFTPSFFFLFEQYLIILILPRLPKFLVIRHLGNKTYK